MLIDEEEEEEEKLLNQKIQGPNYYQ